MFIKKVIHFNPYFLLIPVFGIIGVLTGCQSSKQKLPTSNPMIQITPLSPEDQQNLQALMNKAQNAEKSGKDDLALNTYQKVWEHYENSSDAPNALYAAAKIRQRHHQYADSFYCYDKLLSQYPGYPRLHEVVRDQFNMANELMEGARPYYFGVIPGFRSNEDAIDYFEGIVKKAPFSEYAPLALMNIALISEKNDKPVDAIDALERLIDTYPKNILTADAYFKTAQLYQSIVQGPSYDQGATKDAIHYYEDFIVLFPNHHKIKEAEEGLANMKNTLAESKLSMGNLYRDRLKDNTAAIIFYNEAITAAPNSYAAKNAYQKIQEIQKGIPSQGTPIDFLFTEREHSTKEYMQESYINAHYSEYFEVLHESDLVDITDDILNTATPIEQAFEENLNNNPLETTQENKPEADFLESLKDPSVPVTTVAP